MAGAPKLGSQRERPNSATVMMYLGRTSHTRVESINLFVPDWICQVVMVI
jgi:hypothetical protein